MTLVRSLTEMHGGRIEATSDGPGTGSQFAVWLPIVQASVRDDQPAEVPGQAAAPASRRILVVDDNDDVAQSLGMVLALDGHSVRIAPDGPAALEALHAFAPDVVLLDVGLPWMSGYEVVRQMRESGARPDLVIIALTGYGRADDRLLATQAGCDVHMVKPVDPAALRAALVRAASHPRD